jgi:putative endonuclease
MAIQRETSLKRWYRSWKEALIEEGNPDWRDLWDDIVK